MFIRLKILSCLVIFSLLGHIQGHQEETHEEEPETQYPHYVPPTNALPVYYSLPVIQSVMTVISLPMIVGYGTPMMPMSGYGQPYWNPHPSMNTKGQSCEKKETSCSQSEKCCEGKTENTVKTCTSERTTASTGKVTETIPTSHTDSSTPHVCTTETRPPACTPETSPRAYTPETSPRAYTPETSPRAYTPETSPRAYTPETSPRGYTPETSPRRYTPKPTSKETTATTDLTTPIRYCLPLQIPSNGYYIPSSCVSSSQTINTVCTVQCNQGFQLIGKNQVQCMSSGRWSELPKCRRSNDTASDIVNTVQQYMPANLVFVVDESGSIGRSRFEHEMEFVRKIVSLFPINSNRSAGLILFASRSRVGIPLNKYNNSCEFLFAVDKIVYRSGGTNIQKGLEYAQLEIQLHGEGRRNVIFLLTDGYGCCRPETPASQLKAANNTILGIGIGNFNKNQLNPVASKNSKGKTLVFGIQNFHAFTEVVEYLSTVIRGGEKPCAGYPHCQPLPQPPRGSYNSPRCANESSPLRTKCVLDCGNDLLLKSVNSSTCRISENGSSQWDRIPLCRRTPDFMDALKQSNASNVIYLIQQWYRKEYLEAAKAVIHQLVSLLPVKTTRRSAVIHYGRSRYAKAEINLLETNKSCDFLWELNDIDNRYYGWNLRTALQMAENEISQRGRGNSSLLFVLSMQEYYWHSSYWKTKLQNIGAQIITFCTKCSRTTDELATTSSNGDKWALNFNDIVGLQNFTTKLANLQQQPISCKYSNCRALPVLQNGSYSPADCSVNNQTIQMKCSLSCTDVKSPSAIACQKSGKWSAIPRCLDFIEVAEEIKQIIITKNPRNIMFLLDESWGTSSFYFQNSLDFVRSVVTSFPISRNRSAAFLTYGRIRHESRIYLKGTNNSCEFLYALDGIQNKFLGNNFEDSLTAIKQELLVNSGPTVLFIFFPEKIYEYNTRYKARNPTQELKDKGVTIVVMNQQSANDERLQGLASVSIDRRELHYTFTNISLLMNISNYIQEGSTKLDEELCPGYPSCNPLPVSRHWHYEPSICNTNSSHGLTVCRVQCHAGYLPIGAKAVCRNGVWTLPPICINASGFRDILSETLRSDHPSNIVFVMQGSRTLQHRIAIHWLLNNTIRLFPIPQVHQVAVIKFGHTATTEVSLKEYGDPCELLSDIEDVNFFEYNTNLQRGLQMAHTEIAANKTGNSSIVVVLAWGWKKFRWYPDPYPAAKNLKESGSKIFMFCEQCEEGAAAFATNDSEGRSLFSNFHSSSQALDVISAIGLLERNITDCSPVYSACGGNFNATDGQLISPGYPFNYSENMRCDYYIFAPPQSFVFLHIITVMLQYGDSIKVYDGNTSSGTRLGDFYNERSSILLASIGPMFITFKSRNYHHYYNRKGFKLMYNVKDQWGPCGDVQTGIEGKVTSPRYPQLYPRNVSCEWIVHVSPGNGISFWKTVQIDIENSYMCVNDALQFFHKVEDKWISFGNYCGQRSMLPETIKSSSVKVTFKTDMTVAGNGFQIPWRVNCDMDFYAAAGNITSPGYPKNYIRYARCSYRIHAPAGKKIVLDFLDFHVRSCYRCYCDKVTIYVDGNRIGNSQGYCHINKPPRSTAYRSLEIKFKTSHATNYRGFKAFYYFQDSHPASTTQSSRRHFLNINNASPVRKSGAIPVSMPARYPVRILH